jgi:photosystem II stability/assembly factor-like uncharacterized protein
MEIRSVRHMKPRARTLVVLLISFVLLLVACQTSASTGTPTPTASTPLENEPTITPAPTPTPLPDVLDELTAPVLSLAVDPKNPMGVYALLVTNDLFYSANRGDTWQRLPLGAPSTRYDAAVQTTCPPLMRYDIHISESNSQTMLLRAGRTIYRSEDGGASWNALLDGVETWAASADGELIFALRTNLSNNLDGLYRTQDGGVSWEQVFAGARPPGAPPLIQREKGGCVVLGFGPDEDSLYMGIPGGIYRSFDLGETWQAFNTGLAIDPQEINGVPLMASDGGDELYIFFGAGQDENDRPYLVRLVPGETSPEQDRWEEVGQADLAKVAAPSETSFFSMYAIVADPAKPGQLYLGTEQGVWVSQDYGQTWQALEETPDGRVTRLAIMPGAETWLYLWTGERFIPVSLPSPAP